MPFRQEPQLLHLPCIVPHVLCLGKAVSSEGERNRHGNGGEMGIASPGHNKAQGRAGEEAAQLWDHYRELKGPTSPRIHSGGSRE